MKRSRIVLLCLSAALATGALAQGGTQRQTKLVLPKIQAPDLRPELVVLPPPVHRGGVDGVGFSTDGRVAVSWSADGLLVWDTAARRERCFLRDPWSDVGPEDGTQVAGAVDASATEPAAPSESPGTATEALADKAPPRGIVALSADGTRVGMAGALERRATRECDVIRIWDTRDGRLVSTCRAWNGQPPVLSVGMAALSPDGALVAATVGCRRLGQDPDAGTVALCVWDASSGAELARRDLPVDDPTLWQTVVAFEADGTLLVCQKEPADGDPAQATGGAQGPLRLAARTEWAPGGPLDLVAYRGTRPRPSADGRWLGCTWSLDTGLRLCLWDVAGRKMVTSFPIAAKGGSTSVVACSETRAVVNVPADPPRPYSGGSSLWDWQMWDWRTKQCVQLTPLPMEEQTGLPALSADGALVAYGTRVYDAEGGSVPTAVAARLPARVRFEDAGRRLVWCDERGRETHSWPLDGRAECPANGPQIGDTLLYRDPIVSAWVGSGGLRVVARMTGEETLLPTGSAAYTEAYRLLTEGWSTGIRDGRLPRNDGRAVVARRPDGTLVVASLSEAPPPDGGSGRGPLVLSLAYARADGTVVKIPPQDLWAALGETSSSDSGRFLALSPTGTLLAWCLPTLRSTPQDAVATWDLDTGVKQWVALLPGCCISPPWFTGSGSGLVVRCTGDGVVVLLDSKTGSIETELHGQQCDAFTSDLAWRVGPAAPPPPAPVGPGPPDPLTDPEGCMKWWDEHMGADTPDPAPPSVQSLVLRRAADGAETPLAVGPVVSPLSDFGRRLPPENGRKSAHPGYGPRTDWFACTDLSPDDRFLAVTHSNGVTDLWELPAGGAPGRDPAKVATFVHDLSGASGAVVIPQGYAWSSPGAERFLGWRLGGQVYPYEQFAERFERPDLVRRALAGEEISGEKGVTRGMVPPTAAFLAPEYDAKVAGQSVKVEIEVAGVRPLKRVDLLMDGRPVADEIVATAKEETIEPNHVVISLDLPMPASTRRVRLQAYAYDEQMLRSGAAEVSFTRDGAPPATAALYVLSVGVSRYANEAWNNLRFADADATSFAALAGDGAARRLLVNEDAASSNVRFALKEMKASVTEDDVAAIFLAGHGLLGPNGDYYFLLHDSSEADLANTALKWDDFVAALKALRAKLVLVFADTCHSGSLTGSESINTLIDRLNKKAGVVVFTASRGDEASIERDDWGHGAFTKALLEGFSGQADTYPRDKLVSLAELKEYVIPRVEELTGNRQHPFLPRVEDFDPAQPIAAVNAQLK